MIISSTEKVPVTDGNVENTVEQGLLWDCVKSRADRLGTLILKWSSAPFFVEIFKEDLK